MASLATKADLLRSIDALKINPITRQPIGYGQHIYAYCNIRTNQVLYSLTQILRPQKNLRQLPEAGNNTKPPRLRKDLWRPLWTLSLPSGFQGEAQGLEAWKRLNALRYLHEIYWTPSKELARNRTEAELEALQEQIEERGGSKKENVYDLIKRNKKKLRLKGVMDQKANSIADLSSILVEQEALSLEDPGEYGAEEVKRFLALDREAQEGMVEKLEIDIERLERRVKELVKHMPGEKGNAEASNVRGQRALRNRTRRALKDAQSRKQQLEHAVLIVNLARTQNAEAAPEAQVAEDEQIQEEAPELQNEQSERYVDFTALSSEEQEERRETWKSAHIMKLLGTKSHYLDSDGAQVPTPRAQSAGVARETLIQAEGNTALQDMIAAHERQLEETGISTEEHADPTKWKTMSPDQQQLSIDIQVWKRMLDAFHTTQGSLQVIRPSDGRIFHLGADFAEPATTTSSSVETLEHDLRIAKPGFSMEGVKVTWQNILDAEFAPTWPARVQHDWMGITRHTAPKPGSEPRLSAQEYYEGKVRPRRVEEQEASVRDDVVSSVSNAIIRELIGKKKKNQGKVLEKWTVAVPGGEKAQAKVKEPRV